MNIKETLPLILQVLKDFRVIATVIAMILVVKFAKFVATYKKKPRKILSKKSKISTEKKEPSKPAESQEDSNPKEDTAKK